MSKSIYRFRADCGRMGELEGLLISTKERVEKLIESKIVVYFGEVLGKHSEIYGAIEEGDMTFISDSEEAVRVIEEHDLTSGFNPFDYDTLNYELDGEVLDEISVDEIIDILLRK